MVFSCINMPDNINTAMINSVKETIKASSIWNKLVKTIENANINMDKLIQDSVEYGIEIGMFQQNKDGSIECKDAKKASSLQQNEKFVSPLQQKNTRSDDSTQIITRSAPKSDSETTLSANSSTKSIVTRTRKNGIEKDLKRSSHTLSESNNKRLKVDATEHGTTETLKIKPAEPKSVKSKVKPISKKMVRPIPICAFCLGDEAMNKRTKKPENMISCYDCGTCAHPTCLQWPDSLFQKVRTIRWQCLQCKRCSYCGMISKKDDDMILCDACDQGFHIYCCDPQIKVLPKGEWVCRFCKPSANRKEKPNFFSTEDFEFEPDCQIMTPETVRKLCNISPKLLNTSSVKSHKNGPMKVKSKISKKSPKINLLHLKKKKLVSKAVQRQRQALTDGLSKFFTPSNKRQSRVSKQSISSDSLFDKESKKSPSVTSPKDKGSNRSIISSSRSKSPIVADTIDESVNSQDTPKSSKKKSSNKKVPEISVYNSPKRNGHDTDEKLKGDNVKTKLTKYKLKKLEMSVKTSGSDASVTRRPGRPKKQSTNDKNSNILDCTSVTECSSVTVSKNDLSNNYSMLSTENCESDPYPISDIDRQWYTEIQQKVVELLPPPVDAAPQLQPLSKLNTPCKGRNEHNEPPELSLETSHTTDGDHLGHCNNLDGTLNVRYPPRIQIGRYIIDTWYSAPYPSEYARLNVLYICEYCLKPIKSYDVYIMHMDKCNSYFPPGNEIYRNGDLSVFEVDGYVSKLYCQQLCLLAKLFLDHKTLYYDVEPFLFYVAVVSKNKSSHIIGYFSKEKRSTHKYNLSCIMVLPPHQKYNYGRFLIDFSYLLSRKEGQFGSPEKPLSTLGRISYESYWKSKILPFILNKDDVTVDFYARQKIHKPSKGLTVTIDRMSTETGISPHDVASTIQLLSKKVDLDNSDRISIQFDWEKLKSEAEKYASRYSKWIPIDEDCLRWVPLINPNEKTHNAIKSPSQVVNNLRDSVTSSETDKNKPQKTFKDTNKNPSSEESLNLDTQDTDTVSSQRNKSINPKTSKKKRENLSNKKLPKSPLKEKGTSINTGVKVTSNGKSDSVNTPNKNSRKKQFSANRDEIVTRNKSLQQNSSSVSSKHDSISPIKVDLTKESSENSDIQDNDDCIEISASIPRTDVWYKKKPVFEMFTDSQQITHLKVSPPKESPPLNRNDPSPVSTVQHEIVGPVLISPEIDEENEDENEEVRKWQSKNDPTESQIGDTIDLSDDVVVEVDQTSGCQPIKDRNVFKVMEDRGNKAIEVVFSEKNAIQLPNSEDSLASTTSGTFSDTSKIDEFVLPPAVKESLVSDDCEKPPILSRISSQEDTSSNHLDDSSTSFNLPTDISQTEEFKRFYNDGNVFNSISTSQTDLSEKDADESLLSASNSNSFGISDVDANGSYSCDSSISYNLRPRARPPLRHDEDRIIEPTSDNSDTNSNGDAGISADNEGGGVVCSPGQSDRVHNLVSSTTPFVSPNSADTEAVAVVVAPSNHTVHLSPEQQQTPDHSKLFEITFEDVNFVSNGSRCVEHGDDCTESIVSGAVQCEEDICAISNKHDISRWCRYSNNKTINRGDIVKIDSDSDKDKLQSGSDTINIDVVSSSLNETSIISNSSL